MKFQRILDRLIGFDRPSKRASGHPNRGKRSRGLRLESLQKRELLAADMGSITGIAYIDADGDGVVDAGETRLQNVEVELYLDDVVQNGQFDAGETFVGTMTTGPDGVYTFNNLDGNDVDTPTLPIVATDDGFYILRFAAGVGGVQDSGGAVLTGVQLSGDVGAQVTDDTGVVQQTVDGFTTAQPGQPISQSVVGTATDSSGDLGVGSNVLGQERDVEVVVLGHNDPGNASADLSVSAVTNRLSLDVGSDVRASFLVQYDGIDADGAGLVLDPIGLRNGGANGVSLNDGDAAAGLMLAIRADNIIADALIVTIYTDGANFSTATIDLPNNLADPNPAEIFVPFTAFIVGDEDGLGGGTGADFSDVGAIEASLDSDLVTFGLDFSVSILESRRSNETVANSAATVPLFLGGEVFVDNGGGVDQAEQDNGLLDAGEPVFLATGGNEIEVHLYDTDPSGVGATPIATTTVDPAGGANPGSYLFDTVGADPLGPGTYFVVIPESEFTTGEPLVGFRGSSVDTPVGVTDDDADNDNDGSLVAGVGFVSGPITLTIGGEPTTGNTNTTVDFGVLPEVDLRIDKTINAGASTLQPGGTAVFTITVSNLGLNEATNVVVDDFAPVGLTITSVQDSVPDPVSFTTSTIGGRPAQSFNVGSLAAGASATFTVTATIDGAISSDPINEAQVSGFQVEANIDTVPADRNPGDPLDGALENNIALETVDIPFADISVTKTDSLTTTAAGTQITYTITVTNDAGADAAANVVALDTLPVGTTFVSGTFTDGTGTVDPVVGGADDGKIRAVLGSLAPGEDETFTIIVDVDPDLADGDSPLGNSVTVTADNAPDATATDDTAVTRLTDVTVTKTVLSTRTPDDRTDGDDTDDIIDSTDPFSISAGGFVTYQITATNSGPSVARGVQVTDTLNGSLTLVAGSFDAGTSGATLVPPTGQALTFNLPDLGVGESRTFTFEVQVASNQFDPIANTATISSTDPESDSTNNTGTVSIDPDPRIDLILDKTVAPTTAVPGQDQVVYTFTVSHDTDSLSDAINVDVTDTLPAGLTGVTITGTGITNQNFNTTTRALLVEYASIPVGETRTFTVTADINNDATGTIVNSASVVVPGVTELDTANNSDTATITLTPQFDLVVSKAVTGNTTVGPLDNVTYTIVVSHDTDDDGTEADNGQSPSRATNVVLTDVLPAGLTFTSATAAGAAVTPTNTNGTLVFPAFDLAPGATQTYTITASVNDDANGPLTNNVSFVTAAGETDTNNNSASAVVTVTPQANVRVSKSVDIATAQAGSQLTYTVIVNNDGPSPAANVTAVDTLPAGVTFVSGVGPGGAALSATGQTVTVNGGTLASGGSFQFTIVASVNAGTIASQVNTVNVTTSTAETNSSDNSATATTAIDQAINELSGTIFRDFNNDGILNGMDNPLAGIELLLTGGDLGAAGRRTTTDANGVYQFDDLIAGTYNVQRLTLPEYFNDGLETAGPSATPADAANETIQVIVGGAGGTTAPENDFALVPFLSYKLCIL
ncbi:beta strand repeat-containing protein [Neorhodopirellula pilleata]|uniref:Cna protein B-type domain protein n=1 Tax=Neorhodopirellula pilleata TaxID=2714738 RepID=A0A5C6A4P7_9BACT|nr:SdrD B-like domain-containing protein [Neorhodopirellula pilleata]TWT94347.1 Cna protein B-type domain protein [Neorhodopirellula pilleata]